MEVELNKVMLTSNTEISPGVHVISFKRKHNFIAGQVVKIAIDSEHAPRIYSICSGNQEEDIHILFNIKEDGFLSPKLASAIPGDQILVSKPYGSFISGKGPAWWIATGTGIAPFYSMFRSGLEEGKKLIHGVSFLNQFYFEDDLKWALNENYVPCCSREKSCDTYPGRVTDYIKEHTDVPANIKYYLCGKALMVVEVRDILISKGVPYENILAEIYF